MMYLLAIFLPPVAVLVAGRPGQALINFLLIWLFWVPAVIHAILVVNEYKADKRMERQVKMHVSMQDKMEKRRQTKESS